MTNRSSCRRLAGSLLALTMAVAAIAPAEARLGNSRGSSSRSYSAPSRPPAYSPPPSAASRPSSGRVGSGGAVGMQRPEAMARARSGNPGVAPQGSGQLGAPAAGAVAGAGTGAAIGGASRGGGYGVPPGGAGAQAAPQQRGGSWVGPAIAGAAVGAAAGYALGNRGEQPATGSGAAAGAQPAPTEGSGVAAAREDSSGASGAFSDAAQPTPRPSGMGFMGYALIALLLAAAAMFMFRRKAAKSASTGVLSRGAQSPSFPASGPNSGGTSSSAGRLDPLDAPVGYGGASGYGAAGGHGVATDPLDADVDAQGLMGIAKTFYTQLQDLNNRGDLAELRARTTDDLYPMLASDIQGRSQPSRTTVMSVDAQLLDFTREANRSIASVQFHSVVSEGPNEMPHPVDEVWHFVRDDASSQWKLAGIEQV